MRIGVPKEIKADEQRVAITPAGVTALVQHGHEVMLERGAGVGSHIADEAYRSAGAEIEDSAQRLWERAEMVLKVKEPVGPELARLQPGRVLFTYLHLAASEELTRALLGAGVVAIAYETVQLDDGTLPLLMPMSEVAGRLSIQAGARALEKHSGGKGILLPGVSGVRRGRVTIIGAGTVGFNACAVAVGVGAEVTILDVDARRLAYVRDVMQGHVTTLMSNTATVQEAVEEADLVVSGLLLPGARAPKLLSRELLRSMQPGSALVDVSVDQGGIAETTRPTTHHDPMYVEEGVVHYCVANMPGAVPRTSTYALTNATLQHALHIADHGWRGATARDPALARGLNVVEGRLTCAPVAEAFDMPHTAPDLPAVPTGD